MNINYKHCIIFVFLFLGLTSCAVNNGKIEDGGFRWKIPFDGSDSEPVIYDGIIYIGSMSGAIYAIDPGSGKEIWRYQTGENLPQGNVIYSSGKSFGEMLGAALDETSKKRKGKREIGATPVIEGGVVYVGSKDHRFYALDAQSGKLIWVTEIDQPIWEKALVTDKYIIVHGFGTGRAPSTIYVLRKTNGQIMWSTEGKVYAAYPTFIGDIIYYSFREKSDSSNFVINAVKAKTGEVLWTLELQGLRPNRVYGSDGIIYISVFKEEGQVPNARNNGFYELTAAYIYAINASTGKLVWEFKGGEVNSYTAPSLTLDSKYIYFTSREGLYALDKAAGKLLWFLEGGFSDFNIVIDEFLYVNGELGDDHIYAINPQLGKIIWNYEDDNLFHTKIIDNILYVSAQQSQVAINPSTGKMLWKFQIRKRNNPSGGVTAFPLIYKNHVIFPTYTDRGLTQGYLYSISVRREKAM